MFDHFHNFSIFRDITNLTGSLVSRSWVNIVLADNIPSVFSQLPCNCMSSVNCGVCESTLWEYNKIDSKFWIQQTKKAAQVYVIIVLLFYINVHKLKPSKQHLWAEFHWQGFSGTCLSSRALSRLNCLVNLAKATQSNMRACVSEGVGEAEGGRRKKGNWMKSRHACERLEEVTVICSSVIVL